MFVLYQLYLQGRPISYEDHTRANEFLQKVNPLRELAENFAPTVDDEDVPGDADNLQRFQLIAKRVRKQSAILNDYAMQTLMHKERR